MGSFIWAHLELINPTFSWLYSGLIQARFSKNNLKVLDPCPNHQIFATKLNYFLLPPAENKISALGGAFG